jgi:hypothetical protein
MLKIKRILFIVPILSLPLMCTLETGILVYILSTSSSVLFVNYMLSTQKAKKLLKIPEFLPGSKLEKLVIII